jgi:hypothetical protein
MNGLSFPAALSLAGLALLAGLQPASAALIGYANDFSATGFPTETPDSEWAVTGGSYVNTYSKTDYSPSSASIPITDAAGVDFVMETQMRISSVGNFNSNGATLGLALFSLTPEFSGTNAASAYYLADWMVGTSGTAGRLRILSLGESNGFSSTEGIADDNLGSTNLAITLDTTYTLRVTGTFSGSTLSMTFGVYDAAGTTLIGTTATATDTSPLAGTHFGYRNRIGIGSGTVTTHFDNFSIVPEPGAATLLSLGAASLLLLLRRRRQ